MLPVKALVSEFKVKVVALVVLAYSSEIVKALPAFEGKVAHINWGEYPPDLLKVIVNITALVAGVLPVVKVINPAKSEPVTTGVHCPAVQVVPIPVEVATVGVPGRPPNIWP